MAGITDVVAWMRNAVNALNTINQTMAKVFPQTTGTSGTATGGAAVLPANPVGFITVIDPNTGNTILVPYYNP